MNFRVLITGSRSWTDVSCIRAALALVAETHSSITLVSGACPKGADMLCEMVATEMGWDVERYPADWARYGKEAGRVRNALMVDTSPDMVIGFIHNNSGGTAHTIRLAKKNGFHTVVHSFNDYPQETSRCQSYNVPKDDSSQGDFLF